MYCKHFPRTFEIKKKGVSIIQREFDTVHYILLLREPPFGDDGMLLATLLYSARFLKIKKILFFGCKVPKTAKRTPFIMKYYILKLKIIIADVNNGLNHNYNTYAKCLNTILFY